MVHRAEGIVGVARVPGHRQPVVVCLRLYSERTVLDEVPVAGVAIGLQVEPQLIATTQRQLTEQIVAEPVVAAGVVETGFELRPRTVEGVGPVDVLLDEQRDAAGYRTTILIDISKLYWPPVYEVMTVFHRNDISSLTFLHHLILCASASRNKSCFHRLI